MAGMKDVIQSLMFFKEPEKIEKFILKETKDEKDEDKKANAENQGLFQEALKAKIDKEKTENSKPSQMSKKLSENLHHIKNVYSMPLNSDIILREFDISIKKRTMKAFLIAIDGMVDRKVIDDNILIPLMLLSSLEIQVDEMDVATIIRKHLLTHYQVKEVQEFKKVFESVNFGGCAIFVDGLDCAYTADVKGFEHRGVERPITELVIRGPQEGFNENVRTNTALIRKRLKDEKLIVENMEIGKRSKTPCSMLYIHSIANESLVEEVRRRLKNVSIDYINDSGELEQLIEDNGFLPTPQIVATERPDRVADMLTEGRVAVILNGSPFALVMPVNNFDLIHSQEDAYIRYPYALLLRFVRMMAAFLSLLLPGIYVAITNFHHEMIPTDLLIAIEASREKVPFPSVIEILIMEIAFELIREAGVRIPSPIGPTLGIIGALILGQAAVAANIVSPILIIIVAVTGIGSFAIPNFSLAFSIRILRFLFIILGASAGLLGITTGLFILGVYMANAKSFGVPFLAPLAPRTAENGLDAIIRNPIWNQEKRPDFLNPKDTRKQANMSRSWDKKSKEDKDAK